jgi:hypothetical protein
MKLSLHLHPASHPDINFSTKILPKPTAYYLHHQTVRHMKEAPGKRGVLASRGSHYLLYLRIAGTTDEEII